MRSLFTCDSVPWPEMAEDACQHQETWIRYERTEIGHCIHDMIGFFVGVDRPTRENLQYVLQRVLDSQWARAHNKSSAFEDSTDRRPEITRSDFSTSARP